MSAYYKLIAAAVGVIAVWAADATQGGVQFDQEALTTLVIQLLTLLGIYQVPNTPAGR